MNKTFVVPIDGSLSSINALHFAIETAKHSEGNIVLLNVQAKYEDLQREQMLNDEEIQKLQYLKGNEVMKEAITILSEQELPFITKVRIGIATIEITSEAKEQKAEMIILGSRGNGPVVSAVLGSVTYGVLHLTSCPVTIVPLREL